jgi:hypothetical protein
MAVSRPRSRRACRGASAQCRGCDQMYRRTLSRFRGPILCARRIVLGANHLRNSPGPPAFRPEPPEREQGSTHFTSRRIQPMLRSLKLATTLHRCSLRGEQTTKSKVPYQVAIMEAGLTCSTPPQGPKPPDTYWLVYNCGRVVSTVPFKHRYDLERHFARHGQEFGTASADEYERLAEAFMRGPLRDGALECSRANGDLVRFDPRTDEFGVIATAGHIMTFMIVRPLLSSWQTSMQYFRSNCQ